MENNNSKKLIRKSIAGITTIACLATFHIAITRNKNIDKFLELENNTETSMISTPENITEKVCDYSDIDTRLVNDLKLPNEIIYNTDTKKIIEIMKNYIGNRDYICYYNGTDSLYIQIDEGSFLNKVKIFYEEEPEFYSQSIYISFNNSTYVILFNKENKLQGINYNSLKYINEYMTILKTIDYYYQNGIYKEKITNNSITISEYEISLNSKQTMNSNYNTINIYDNYDYSGGTFKINNDIYQELINKLQHAQNIEELDYFFIENYDMINRILNNNEISDPVIEAKAIINKLTEEFLLKKNNTYTRKI